MFDKVKFPLLIAFHIVFKIVTIKIIKLDKEFVDLLTMGLKEAREIKSLISLYIKKRKDRFFKIYPSHSTFYYLANEFCVKVEPIMEYVIMRFREKGFKRYEERLIKLLHSISFEKMNYYFYKLNGENSYGSSIYRRKLELIVKREHQKIVALILLIYSLSPLRERPFKPQTIGLSNQEFMDIGEAGEETGE